MNAATRDEGAGGDKPLAQAAEIFLTVREMGLAARDEEIERQCAGSAELKDLVLMLLRGDNAPLPVESLADDIRAAQITSASEPLSPTMPLPVAATPPESRIGNYKLLERLGEGGFGIVYMAEQEKPVRRRVALKIIKLGMDTRQVVARFEAERQALAMMDHPGIARVFDAGATDTGRPYFVMELVRGLPITEYCDQHRLPIRQRLHLVAQVCEALQHAHQKGVIHRDIKPSNVLVSTVGDQPVPKIIDFGIAKATSSRLSEKTIFTEFRQMIGTPEYMSPEQAGESSEGVDTRTDIYSVGVLLYELLTGAPPFDSSRLRSAAYGEMQRIIREEDPLRPSTRLKTRPDTLGAIASVRALPPAKLSGVIRGELDWITMKALEKDRARRYDSAGSMARDIQRHLNGEAVQAAPPSALYRARKFAHRNKGPVLAASLLAVALVAGLIGTSLGFFNASLQRAEAESQRDRANTEKERADANATEARAAESAAQNNAYSANLLAACMSVDHLPGLARIALDAAPQDLRGWEWRMLNARLDTSVGTVPAPHLNVPSANSDRCMELLAHPDGRTFFTTSRRENEVAQRRDLETGQVLTRFRRPSEAPARSGRPTTVTLSADATVLYTVCQNEDDGPVEVAGWNVDSGENVISATVMPARPTACDMTISPDGTRLVLSDLKDLWMQSVADGAVIATAQRAVTRAMRVFNPDGTILAVDDGRGNIELLDGHSLAFIAPLNGHRNMITTMEFSRDGRWMATGSLDGTGRVWDLNATPPTATVLEHTSTVQSHVLPDASLALTEGDDGNRVWNVRTGEVLCRFVGENLIRGSAMLTNDGKRFAARESDGTVRFWNVTAESTFRLRGHRGIMNGARFAGDSGLIVSAGWDGWGGHPGCIRFWDADSGEEVANFGAPGEVASFLAVSRDGRRAAASISHNPGTERGVIINLATGHVVDLPPNARSFAFDPSGTFLAVARSARLEIVDAQDGMVLRSREAGFEGSTVNNLQWSPDGRRLVCELVPNDPSIEALRPLLLDATSLETLRLFKGKSIILTPNGGRLLCETDIGVYEIWDAGSLELLSTVRANGMSGTRMAFNPDESRFAITGPGNAVTIWNAKTFEPIARLTEGDYVANVDWDSSGSRLIGSWGRTIHVWDEAPIGKRVQSREARAAAMEIVAPLVERLFAELGDATRVIASLDTHAGLSELQRKVARQEILRRGLARQ